MTDEITLDAPETRIERFLAAAAGVEGITLDEPETRIERYLYKIAQGGGSGGVLVVHIGEGDALDKTWNEIDAADVAVIVFSGSEDGETWHSREFVTSTSTLNGNYFVSTVYDGGSSDYTATDPDGYPIRQD